MAMAENGRGATHGSEWRVSLFNCLIVFIIIIFIITNLCFLISLLYLSFLVLFFLCVCVCVCGKSMLFSKKHAYVYKTWKDYYITLTFFYEHCFYLHEYFMYNMAFLLFYKTSTMNILLNIREQPSQVFFTREGDFAHSISKVYMRYQETVKPKITNNGKKNKSK